MGTRRRLYLRVQNIVKNEMTRGAHIQRKKQREAKKRCCQITIKLTLPQQEEASEVIHSSIHKPTILSLSLSFESSPQVISPFGS